MLRFLITRLWILIPTFLGVTLVAFSLIRLVPGDPIELLVGERGIDPSATPCCGPSSASTGHSGSSTSIYLGGLAQGDSAARSSPASRS